MKNVFFNHKILDVEKDIIGTTGVPSIVLMENAGLRSADLIIENFPEFLKYPVSVIAGKGNNAGDGFVIARHLLLSGYPVNVFLLFPYEELKGDGKINFDLLKNIRSPYVTIFNNSTLHDLRENVSEESLVIDALFGVGFKGELDEKTKEVVQYINSLENVMVISLDTPSGLFVSTQESEMVRADVTIAMGVKKFHSIFYNGKEASGEYVTVDIGIPGSEFTKRNHDNIFEIEENDIKSCEYTRGINTHKYSNGKIFILGGAKGLSGAPCMSTMASLRAGCGSARVGTPSSLQSIIEIKLTEPLKASLPETNEGTLSLAGYDSIVEFVNWSDACLIGPGISKNVETGELIRKIVSSIDHNFVLDAEGIYAFLDNEDLLKKKKKLILTPHFGEFATLLNITTEELKKDFYTLAMSFAKNYNVVLVLKNAPSIITDGETFYINPTGKENLATAGTGDVLSGIIASLYSQKDDPMQAALAGTYIHGMCGNILYEKTGSSSTIATDLIDLIPEVKNTLFCS